MLRIIFIIFFVFTQCLNAYSSQSTVKMVDSGSNYRTFYLNGQEIAKELWDNENGWHIKGQIPDGPVEGTDENYNLIWVYQFKNNNRILDSVKILNPQGDLPKGLYLSKDNKLNGILQLKRKSGDTGIATYKDGWQTKMVLFNSNGVKTVEMMLAEDHKSILSEIYTDKGRTEAKISCPEEKSIYFKQFDVKGNIIFNKDYK